MTRQSKLIGSNAEMVMKLVCVFVCVTAVPHGWAGGIGVTGYQVCVMGQRWTYQSRRGQLTHVCSHASTFWMASHLIAYDKLDNNSS